MADGVPRLEIDLAGEWRQHADPGRRGESLGWAKAVPEAAQNVRVPGAFQAGSGPVWYWRSFEADPTDGRPFRRLIFEGVAGRVRIWLNGVLLGEREGGLAGFELDVSHLIQPRRPNLLAMLVESGPATSGAQAWQALTGPVRGVRFEASVPVFVRRVQAHAVPVDGAWRFTARMLITNAMDNTANVLVDLAVKDAVAGRTLADAATHESLGTVATVPPGYTGEAAVEAVLEGLAPWTLESPRLYEVSAVISKGVEGLEPAYEDRYRILIGAGPAAEAPAAEALRRVAPYPPPAAFLAEADRQGWPLAVCLSGIPPDQLRAVLANLDTHPSIRAWAVEPGQEALERRIAALDPGRPVRAIPDCRRAPIPWPFAEFGH
jgi:beta-galactosidase/beta-glucuronidase